MMSNDGKGAIPECSQGTKEGPRGLAIPRVGLGTAPIGNLFSPVTDDEAAEVLGAAAARGINYFDTAPLYGHGLAERRLGRSLSLRSRQDFVLSTKVGRLLRAGAPPDPSQFFEGKPFYAGPFAVGPVWDFSYDGVFTSVEESCERLGTDWLDMVLLHDPDRHFTEASTSAYQALVDLRSRGMTKAIGAGMNQTGTLSRLVDACDLDVVLLSGRYTLLDQEALDDLFPVCQARQTAVVIGGVFNSGVLVNPSAGARFDYVPATDGVLNKAVRIQEICQEFGVPLGAAALQFPYAHPCVTSVLLGCRSEAELDLDLAWLDLEIPRQMWETLRSTGLVRIDAPLPGDE